MRLAPKRAKFLGFTIIEVMIVLAIAGLILLVVFLAIPSLQATSRDYQRKNFAIRTVTAVMNFGSTYGRYPVCSSNLTPAVCPIAKNDAIKFLTSDLPDGIDPVTGLDYKSGTIQDYTDSHGVGVSTASLSVIYYYDESKLIHSVKPVKDQVLIVPGHFCYSGGTDTVWDGGPSRWANLDDSLAVLTYLERGSHFLCVDNADD